MLKPSSRRDDGGERRIRNLKKKLKEQNKLSHRLTDLNLSLCICAVTLTGGHDLQADHLGARAEELQAFRILVFPLGGGRKKSNDNGPRNPLLDQLLALTSGSNLRLEAPGAPLGKDTVLVLFAVSLLVLLLVLLLLLLRRLLLPNPLVQLLALVALLVQPLDALKRVPRSLPSHFVAALIFDQC